jgi:hypothetical protein
MGKAEEKYKYLSQREKYDPDVRNAVGKKSLTEKDANTVNKIQEMMRKEREKKGDRNIVTSENREKFMAKKLKLDEMPKEDEQDMPETKYVVKYLDEEGNPSGSEKRFNSESEAVNHAKKGNMVDKVGGKYVVEKMRVK